MKKINEMNKKKILQTINLLEELQWIFNAKRNYDFEELSQLLRDLLLDKTNVSIDQKYVSPNPNKNFLVGILPILFQDEELFKTNSEMLDFAESVLKVNLSRAGKRSRFEYIGLIVCEVTKLNEKELTKLVYSLSLITASKKKLKLFKEAKKGSNFSWNDTIRKLSEL